MLKLVSSFTGYGYITVGIAVGPEYYQGSFLVEVKEEASDSINFNLNRYINILRSEGWNVMVEYVSRDSSVVFTKSVVKNVFSMVADLKYIVIFGHIPVPYFGNIAPDGHGNHVGA